jgi:hypothetical protein
MAYERDLRQPFSHAAHVAAYLRDLDVDDAVVVGSFDYSAQPITAYLDGPIYYPEDERFGTFVHWGKHRRMLAPMEVIDAAVRLADAQAKPVVLVLSYPLAQQRPGDVLAWGGHRLVYLTAFVGAVVPDENYHLYLLQAPPGRVVH